MRVNDVLNALGEIQYLLGGPISRQEHETFRDEAQAWSGFPSPRPMHPEEKRQLRALEKLGELHKAVGEGWIHRVLLPEDLPFTQVRVPMVDSEPELLDTYADRLEFRFLRDKRRYGATYYLTRQNQPEALPFVMEELIHALIEEIKKVDG